MEKLINNTSFWVIILAWLLLQFIQAFGTPIHYDEAYYWMFSKFLAFGYFDHPPAVALLIRLSDTFFNGIIGVRFFTILIQLLGFYFLWKLVDNNQDKKFPFIALLFCLPFFHFLGFITTPDVPLLFSAILFFYSYKTVVEKNRWTDYLFWGVTMAALLYSKYHGVLLIFFVLISNPKLLHNPKTYFAGTIGLLLWTPHLYWQYVHDFPSFRYHLFERTNSFKWFYPLEYIGNTLLIFNPLLIGLWIKIGRLRSRNLFDWGLKCTFFGFLLFFAYQSSRDHVQPQWVVLCYIPLILLFLNHWKPAWNKNLRISLFVTIPIILIFRLALVIDLLPQNLGVHRYETYMEDVKKSNKGLPVMFMNSYKSAALYSWYGDQPYTHSYNTYDHRKNQFNIWKRDSVFAEKPVFLVGGKYKDIASKKVECRPAAERLCKDAFSSTQTYDLFDKLEFKLEKSQIQKSHSLYQLTINNPYDHTVNINSDEVQVYMQLFNGKKRVGKLWSVKQLNLEIPANNEVIINQFQMNQAIRALDETPTHVGFCLAKSPWPAASILKKHKL